MWTRKTLFYKQKDKNTALHLAIARNYDEIADYLIANGANEIVENAEGYTPWDMREV